MIIIIVNQIKPYNGKNAFVKSKLSQLWLLAVPYMY